MTNKGGGGGGGGGGGFFSLFDWNRKSRKKLFASPSPEGSAKHSRKTTNDLPAARLILDGEDDSGIRGVSGVKESSEHSCSSSITNEDGCGNRVPGVVAKLMGLDSLPVAAPSDPNCTASSEHQYWRDGGYQKGSPNAEFNTQMTNTSLTSEAYSKKPPELKRQKIPSSPLERFQSEMLPPRSGKSLPVSHYKVSPVRNAKLLSSKDAAYVMENAAKILKPGFQTSVNQRVPSIGSSIPLKTYDPKGRVLPSQRSLTSTESARKLPESNTTMYLKRQPGNKSKSDARCRSFDWNDTSSTASDDKGKSVSLAVQAKANVQQREGANIAIRKSFSQKEQDRSRTSQPSRNQSSYQKNKVLNKASSPGASTVLKQNNQKQNCSGSKDKLPAKSTINQHSRRNISKGASFERNKSLNNFHGNSKLESVKEGLGATPLVHASSFRINSSSRKKRPIDGESSYEAECTTNILVGRREKHIHPNIISIDEHLTLAKDDKSNGTDIVSFTFMTPVVKSTPEDQPVNIEKQEKKDDCIVGICCDKNAKAAKHKGPSNSGNNTISGDDLGILLEEKLKELSLKLEAPYRREVKTIDATPAFTLQDLLSTSENSTSALEDSGDSNWRYYKDSFVRDSNLRFDPFKDLTWSRNIKPSQDFADCSISSDPHKEFDHQQSPFSILEATFSNESCNSSDHSINGGRLCSANLQGSIETEAVENIPLFEAEIKLSYSASSSFTDTTDEGEHGDQIKTWEHEIYYLREILSTVNLDPESPNFVFAGGTLDPCIFDKLESKRMHSTSTMLGDARLKRKVLFDYVSESLCLKCTCYFDLGYRGWTKGAALIGKEGFAEKIHIEISEYRRMGSLMVDELVDKDMSSSLGRWVDFEVDAFEAGIEIEEQILDRLIFDMVDEFLVL